MRKYEMTKIKKQTFALAMAVALGLSVCPANIKAYAQDDIITETETVEDSIENEELSDSVEENSLEVVDEEINNEMMKSQSSKHSFKTDGTDGQLPDEEWALIEAKYNELKGQTMDCSMFVNLALYGEKRFGGAVDAGAYLTANGYYQVGTKVDFTDGYEFTEKADATAAKIRRGDVIVFSNDDGLYTHIAIANVAEDGTVCIYHGGVYGNGANGTVDNTTLAWYMSGSTTTNAYGDNVEIYRKKTNGDYDAALEEKKKQEEELFNTTLAVRYNTHIQNIGWENDTTNVKTWKHDGEMSGTSGKSYRLEGITVKITGTDKIGVAYNTHIQNIGWENDVNDSSTWKHDGDMSGTSGKAYRLEAIQMKLTGEDAAKYSIYYRVHVQNLGWLNWACDGDMAGTRGLSYRLEGIEIKVLPKGERPEGGIGGSFYERGKGASNSDSTGLVNYMTHVQNDGDQSYVYDGSMSGTSGESKRLEGIRIKLNNDKIGTTGSIHYLTHVQNDGWQGDEEDVSTWKQDGEFSGTSGKSYRLEAIRIMLSGDMAQKYDIYYRVHVQNFGWLDWACNGAVAGTTGYAYRLEGIEIKLVEKGGAAPGETTKTFMIKE